MTRNKLISLVVAGAVVVAAVVVGAFLVLGRDEEKSTKPVSAPTALAEDVPTDVVTGEPDTSSPEPVAPGVTMTPPDPKAVAQAKASPIPVPENVDGCDHAYGVSICVPWEFPKGVDSQAEKCEYLKVRGFTRLEVPGRDRHGLDPDKNKIACDN
ncbi:hypothetical protein EDD29_1177 [Actinocorallia herbida]|uniref:Excalibur calcium-binding domain-containing protein n=1 Tax=Actinocorallia herbida TaxID=58109 RepID=A0A3N1CQT9_9ACTN|nr:hypothetical protein [Actinocorallia herbida]ROO83670.1 hypothetical protein EDD29_1177 [Actinocorallia herbida]